MVNLMRNNRWMQTSKEPMSRRWSLLLCAMLLFVLAESRLFAQYLPLMNWDKLTFPLLEPDVWGTASEAERQTSVDGQNGQFRRLGLEEAIASAIERNHEFKIRRLVPEQQAAERERRRAAFDATFGATISNSDRLGKQIQQSGALGDNVANRTDVGLNWEKRFPSGTQAEIEVTTGRNRSARAPNLFSTRVGINLTRPLRQGAGREVNLVSLRSAELDERISRYELEAYLLALVGQIEKKYWDFFLALREREIVKTSLELARMQRDETAKRIELGSIPESELAAADAEVALREEAYINAGSQVETTRISLLRMINPDSEHFWKYHLELTDEPTDSDFPATSPQELIDLALVKRPELKQAQLDLEKGNLDLIRTKNGLLPRLDFFTTLGKSGYAQTFEDSADKFGAKGYDLQAGVLYELALGRRDARMQVKRSELSLKRSQEAIYNLRQLVQEDVLKAFLEAKRAALQIRATEKTVAKQQEKLRVETIKFSLGKTTAFQVAQAQRDVAASQITALKSRVGYLQALTDLYRYAGILCERRKIEIADQPE